MSEHFDALETREPAQREAQLLAALPAQLAHAQQASAAFREILAGAGRHDRLAGPAMVAPLERESSSSEFALHGADDEQPRARPGSTRSKRSSD